MGVSGSSADTLLDPPLTERQMYSLQANFPLAFLFSGIMIPRPFRDSSPPTQQEVQAFCHFAKQRHTSHPTTASRPVNHHCRGARSALKNHFAMLCLLAISTEETESTCRKLTQVKKQNKATTATVKWSKFPNQSRSPLTLLILPQKLG